uniref:Tight junction protein ZO-1 n=1 Tax=Anopheles albimanus TaxID=7167 RepID=A0A182F7Q1_ANOAL
MYGGIMATVKELMERTSWDYNTVTLSRVQGYGFGIAVSGGRDNPHFANGDPSIAVSDVLKNGPAEGQLQVNDRITSVNGISLENVEYATAVQVLRDSGNTVTLMVKRRVPNHSLLQPLPANLLMPGSSGPIGGGGAGGNGGPGGPGGGGGMGQPGQPGAGVSMPPPHATHHHHQHQLSSHSSTGLGLAANNGSQQQIKVIVAKANKKDDFGIVLGCRLFIREISSKTKDQLAANGYSLQEGDVVTRIHNTNCNDSMSLKEAKKIIDGCKERLTLAVVREGGAGVGAGAVAATGGGYGTAGGAGTGTGYSHAAQVSNCSNMDDSYLNGGGSYSGQNLYVQPPTRPSAMSTLLADDKSNLTPRGRSRGPLTDISLQQLDRPSTPPGTSSRTAAGGGDGSLPVGHSRSRSVVDEPPRPPPPRGEDFYATRRQMLDEQQKPPSGEPRYITFQKEGSVGIRLTGGNEVGIFVTAVQQNSPASAQGLVPGDKLLKVNDMDMNGVTREEAVLFLLSLQDRIDLIVQYCREEFDSITAQQRGDSFHIKTHFHCDNPSKGELSFKAGDVFRVIDTLYNGVVGAWQVLRIGRGHQELQRGVIPNKARAEELATVQFNASKKELNASESRVSFFRRRRSTHRRSKSLSRENWDDVVFSDAISKFPAYERVVLRHPGFVRPVVIFGPVADIARERLMKDFPDKYTAPLQDDDKGSSKCGGIVRLSNIRDIMDRGKHALLDVTPNAVDRLNYAQFYPIVLFLKAESKHTIKQMRQGLPKSAHKSSKKLFEQCQKLERVWSHVFSTTINLNDPDTWYRKLRDSIDQQQSGAVWMSETKRVELASDIFLPYFPPPCPLSCCNYVSPLPAPPPPLPLKPYAGGGHPARAPYRYSMPAANYNALSVAAAAAAAATSQPMLLPHHNDHSNGYNMSQSYPSNRSNIGHPMMVSNGALRHSNPTIQQSTLSLAGTSHGGGGKSSTATGSSEHLLYDDEQLPAMHRQSTATVHATPYYHNPSTPVSSHRDARSSIFERIRPYSTGPEPEAKGLQGKCYENGCSPVESLSDDFLFPMTTSRLSYASSPESDLELSPGPSASLSLGNLPQLVKSSSDPSIATNQDNLDRDRELGDGMPPPYTNPYEHAAHPRRMTVDNKYGFSANSNAGTSGGIGPTSEDAIYGTSTARPAPPIQGAGSNGTHFGAVPDLPPRIDRASKPPASGPGGAPGAPTSTPGSSLPSRNSSSGGTLGRSAQERLFGSKQPSTDALHDPSSSAAVHDEYSSRSQLLGLGHGPDPKRSVMPMLNGAGGVGAGPTGGGASSLERNPNTSLDRSRSGVSGAGTATGGGHQPSVPPPQTGSSSNNNTPSKANGSSYDSVSSYDSYNATTQQLAAQNMRLGPNAPDDLKSVPNNRNGVHPMQASQPGMSEYGVRNPAMSNAAGQDMLLTTAARGNYNGMHDPLAARNSGDRTGGGMNMAQRPTNLVLDSPRKHMIETKTDYGKYSRNNSASQADYSKPNKGPSMIGSPGPAVGPGAGPGGVGNGGPFKPVPPPKPKNYRPPIGGGGVGSNGSAMHHSGQWDNGEPISPRSPDGFYYPPMPSSHYHHQGGMAHNVPSSPNQPPMHPMYGAYGGANGAPGGNGGGGGQAMYNGNHANGSHSYMGNGGIRDMAMGTSNGYNTNGNAQYPYGNTYMQRGNMPALHPSDRHALDLAGSREQRGSAFELYRKPQLGTVVGHHHNIRGDVEPMMSIHEFNQHQQHLMHQQRMRHLQQQPLPPIPPPPAPSVGAWDGRDPSLPPALPAKPPKKNILKSPLKAIRNAFIKSTRPLRRQVSLVESQEKKSLRPILKRQHSLMEPRTGRMRMPDPQYDQRAYYAQQQQQQQQLYYNDPRYPAYHQESYSPRSGYQRHEAYYPKDGNSTYQNLEMESIYGSGAVGGPSSSSASFYDHQHDRGYGYHQQQQHQQQQQQQQDLEENLYANRALIELERGRGQLGPGAAVSTLGRRIVRRHSMADRSAPSPSFGHLNRRRMGSERGQQHAPAGAAPHHAPGTGRYGPGAIAGPGGTGSNSICNTSLGTALDESIYQSKSGSFLYNEAASRAEHASRARAYDDQVYQSRREMHRDHLYQSKKQMQDRIQQSRLEQQQQQQQQHGSPGASGHSRGSSSTATTSGVISGSERFARKELATSGGGGSCSSSSSPNSPSSSSGKSSNSASRNGELRERRSQMRDQIHQSRKEAMESMAEPVYAARGRELKHEPIYESKNELDSVVSDGRAAAAATEEVPLDALNRLQIAEPPEDRPRPAPRTAAPLAAEEDDDDDVEEEQKPESDKGKDEQEENRGEGEQLSDRTLSSSHNETTILEKLPIGSPRTTGSASGSSIPEHQGTPRSSRATHISNFLKRTAPPVMPPPPPPPTTTLTSSTEAALSPSQVYASRTSIETQYTATTTSQMSLPIGPPNATSTPFASEMSLGLPPPRQPITRRAIFDATGGNLCDPIWNVSLHIPPGAIAPGVQQEIYFTVTDPRLSETVGGPPLDMENGETMLSPLVMCGPQGTEFLQPVTLNIPHCAGRTASLGLSLKATDSEKNLRTDWEDIDLPSNTAAHTVSVKVDHF